MCLVLTSMPPSPSTKISRGSVYHAKHGLTYDLSKVAAPATYPSCFHPQWLRCHHRLVVRAKHSDSLTANNLGEKVPSGTPRLFSSEAHIENCLAKPRRMSIVQTYPGRNSRYSTGACVQGSPGECRLQGDSLPNAPQYSVQVQMRKAGSHCRPAATSSRYYSLPVSSI